MASIHFERTVTKFEFQNKCILLQDDKGNDYRQQLAHENVRVASNGTNYDGVIKEFYYKGNFKPGIVFDDHGDGIHSFFFEQGVLPERILRVEMDPDHFVEPERHLLNIQVILLTKEN
jgi:hypothetical protein